MDFPGVDTENGELFEPYLQNVDKCHTFIFMIDTHKDHGVNKQTLQKLMSDISKTILMESATLDPESALFLCTNCPKSIMEDKEEKSKLTYTILSKIHACWPMVVESQIKFIDDMREMKNGPASLMELQNRVKDFLLKSQRLQLEEHCTWLIDLVEKTIAYIKFGKKWKSKEDVDRIDGSIRESFAMLHSYLEQLGSQSSSTMNEINRVNQRCKNRLVKYLNEKTQKDELTVSDVKSLYGSVESETTKEHLDDWEKEIDGILIRLMKKIEEEHIYGKIHRTGDRSGSLSAFGDKLVFPLMILFLWPVGLGIAVFAVYEYVKSIVKNNSISKKNLIDKVVRKMEDNINAKLNKIAHDLGRQKDDLANIISQNQKSRSTIVQKDRLKMSEEFSNIAKNIWDIYVGLIMSHEFSLSGIQIKDPEKVKENVFSATIKFQHKENVEMAVKKIEIEHLEKNGEEDYTHFLPFDSSIFREKCLLRHLSMKKGDEDYPYFVHYEGSAGCIDENSSSLHIVIKKYKCSLEVVLDESHQTDEKTKVQHAVEAARGLRFLHNNEVIHGDLRLSSYLVDENDHVVIFELGHSKQVDALQTSFPSESVKYLAPELRGPLDIFLPTKSSDIYSFGLLLWELWNRKSIKDNVFVEKQIKETGGGMIELIRACVCQSPHLRPTIKQVVSKLDVINQSFR